MSDSRPAVMSLGYVGLYTQIPGLELQLGGYGLATNTHCCAVPPEVAEEFRDDERLGRLPLAVEVTSEQGESEDGASEVLKTRKRGRR